MNSCIFCRIVGKEIGAEILYEDSTVLAFQDIHPQAPVHVLVIPKKHVAKMTDVSAEDLPLIADIHRVIQNLVRQKPWKDSGFRLVVNNGPNAGQAVDHLHYHLLAGRKLGWPPG